MSTTPWKLTPQQVIESPEVLVLVYHNVYPEGKQGGLEIIQHDLRVATNGDVRLEPAPGQWAVLPKVTGRSAALDEQGSARISVDLEFAQQALRYSVRTVTEGASLRVSVDLHEPLPAAWVGRAGFNLELLPTAYDGKAYLMDETFGAFPHQNNGPVPAEGGEAQPPVLARGRRLTAAAGDPLCQLDIEALNGELILLDGRAAAQNGWFVVRSLLPAGKTQGALEWRITPNRIEGWQREPQILYSQVGYHPDQEKQALIEMDPRVTAAPPAALLRLTPAGPQEVFAAQPDLWGRWLHYQYAVFDFTQVREPGMYQLRCGGRLTMPFMIAPAVYQQGVWQPALETFLPNQMCHMRVEDIYRVWHGVCHLDDALQAPPNHEHFDGYRMYGKTETPYPPFTHVPGLDRGGWHDAGDYDLATGSQANTTYLLALAREAFQLDSDQTLIDRVERLVQLHVPDGVPDVVQQVAHGVDILLSGYHAAGHSFTGIIEGSLRQYVHLGDPAAMTDNVVTEGAPDANSRSVVADDRWVFTNHDTALEYQVAAVLAAARRVLRGYDDSLAGECLSTALEVWQTEHAQEPVSQPNCYQPRNPQATEAQAALELYLTTGDAAYFMRMVELWPVIEGAFDYLGWTAARALLHAENNAALAQEAAALREKMLPAVRAYQQRLSEQEAASPFRLPFGPGWLDANRPDHDPFADNYHPPIWGVGWSLQGFAVHHYYLLRAFPDMVDSESLLRVLNYVLGCHPANNLSLVSGVGAQSLTIAYGTNRAEWSHTPGGVASGPALLRPNIIELLDPFPWLWQQKEYVIGGAASYIFLVLAADHILNQ